MFVEGSNDFKIIRRFAKKCGFTELAAGVGITSVKSGGFDSWEKIRALAWGLRNILESPLIISAVFDRDYRPEEQMLKFRVELEREIKFVHVHMRKEVENYLLVPGVLRRAANRAIKERTRRTGEIINNGFDIVNILNSITRNFRSYCSGQYISKYCEYFRSSGKDQATLTTEALERFDRKWAALDSRLEIVAGKDVLKAVRERFQEDYCVTLTDFRIIDCYRREEIPRDLMGLLRQLDSFRSC